MISMKRVFGRSGKVILGSFILSIICLGISANTKTYAQKEEWDEYINYSLGIRFEYPVSWEFSKPDTNDGKKP
jgi:hypothetical protein